MRLFAGRAGCEAISVGQDLEPDYISVAADGLTALVTLQENNPVAVLEIASAPSPMSGPQAQASPHF